MKALDIANQTEEVGHPKLAVVLWQNIQLSRGVDAAGSLLLVLRTHEVKLFRRAQERANEAPAQDVEMDCFGFEVSQ